MTIDSVKKRLTNIPSLAKSIFLHALLVLFLICLSQVIVLGMAQEHAGDRARVWTADLQPFHSENLKDFKKVKADDFERERLAYQLSLAKRRAKHHLDLTIYFFTQYYQSILQSAIFGAIAAIALFFITKSGFSAASHFVINIFIAATTVATMYGSFPSLFKQTDNIAQNKALYLKHIDLQNAMLTYSATGLDSNGEKLAAAEYIVVINKELETHNKLAVGFDFSKLPYFTFQSP
jgi:hypothetical protein